MNHFELFEVPISLIIKESEIKKKYFKLSRDYHPDRFIHESKDRQEEAQVYYAKINKAYDVLNDRNNRIEYILDLSGLLKTNKSTIDPMFLMEMMELNERLEAQTSNYDKNELDLIKNQITNFEIKLMHSIEPIDKLAIIDLSDVESLNNLKAFYLKMKYILRIKEKLLTFAIQ